MSSTPVVAVDRDIVEHSFRAWQEEQTLLDAQLAESVTALDAYQSHLDAWQQDLVRERDELRQLRDTAECDQTGAGVGREQIEHLNKELEDSRAKVSSLTAALLSRTEELRDLDRQRESANAELALARAREQELVAALAARQPPDDVPRHPAENHSNHQPEAIDQAVEQATSAEHGESATSLRAKPEPRRSASPVLGSVMEQFGKLRMQRSMKSNNKPR